MAGEQSVGCRRCGGRGYVESSTPGGFVSGPCPCTGNALSGLAEAVGSHPPYEEDFDVDQDTGQEVEEIGDGG